MNPSDRPHRLLAALALATLSLPLAGYAAPARAQDSGGNAAAPTRKQPLVVESDQMLIRDARQEAIYTGNVVATKGDMVLHAHKVVVKYSDEGLRTVHAYGSPVKMDQGDRHGEADTAVYDAGKRTVLLVGNAFLREGPNSLKGARIRYFVGEKRTEVYSTGKTEGKDQGRARAVFQPGSKPGGGEPGAGKGGKADKNKNKRKNGGAASDE